MPRDATKRRPAWDGDPPGAESARERLVAAAAKCIDRYGMSGVSISAVAEAAGVSRPTVYRYFDNRNELVVAALVEAGEQFRLQNSEYLQQFQDPGQMAVESALNVLRSLSGDSVLGKIWSSEKDGMLDAAIVAAATQPQALAHTRGGLQPLVDAAGWDDDEALEAVEIYTRFVVSLLLAPEPKRSREELRAFLRRRLVPALGL